MKVGISTIRILEMRNVQVSVRKYLGSKSKSHHLLNKRLFAEDEEKHAKSSIRLYFIEKVYQFLTESTLPNTLKTDIAMKIGMVGEYCITLMYLDNHFQDGKYGVVNDESRKQNRLERSLTMKALDNFVMKEFSGKIQEKILQSIQKLFFLYHKGMKLDKDCLTLENFLNNNPHQLHRINEDIDSYVNVDQFIQVFNNYKVGKYPILIQQDYLRLLFTRAFLINAVFFQIFTELLIDLYGKPGESYGQLLEFSRMYGMAQQLVNDNCDYLPLSYGFETLCKLPEDTFSDIRRKLVTLPIMTYFSHERDYRESLYQQFTESETSKNFHTNEYQEIALRELLESGSLSYSKGSLCAFALRCEALVSNDVWKNFLTFVRGNRYYKEYSNY